MFKNLWIQKKQDEIIKKLGKSNFNYDLGSRIYTSRLIGSIPDLVMHGGGNTSCKSITKNIYGNNIEIICIKGSGWDLETITNETAAYKQEASRLFNEIVNTAAAEMNKTNVPINNIINHILEFNEDEDILFKAKLAVMELESTKESKAIKVKQDIRKAKSLIELISHMNNL